MGLAPAAARLATRALGLGALVLALAGCATLPPLADGWSRMDLPAGGRVFAAETRPGPVAEPGLLTVVIEGDGITRLPGGIASPDPTSPRPTGLRIAHAWPSGPVAWLGRACQFVRRRDPACSRRDWTDGRYAEPLVSAMNDAVDRLKAQAGATRVQLVGWSGGGLMALLIAARRSDVAGLATFASPLDLPAWARLKGARAFSAPAPPERLDVPQVHVFGLRDKVVPPLSSVGLARRLAAGPHDLVAEAPESHLCCWRAHAREAAVRLALARSEANAERLASETSIRAAAGRGGAALGRAAAP